MNNSIKVQLKEQKLHKNSLEPNIPIKKWAHIDFQIIFLLQLFNKLQQQLTILDVKFVPSFMEELLVLLK